MARRQRYESAVSDFMGAAAGAGGIGYELFMAGNFYFDMREMGIITYVVVITVIILETLATKIKEKAK